MKETYGLLLPILLPILGGFVCRLTVAAGEKKESKTLIRCGEVTFLGLCFVTLILTVVFGIGPIQNGGHVLLSIPEICGRGIYFRVDEFRALYGILAAFCWTVSAAFALWYMKGEENRGRYFFYTLLTLGATLGVFYAAEFYTLFIFFEVMSLASYLWVVHEETGEVVRASKTYLAVAVIGGLVMLMGIFLLESNLGTLNLQDIAKLDLSLFNQKQLRIAGFCLLFGFGAKAGAFPLHIWLPKAHPVAPAPASALLSGILTKAGMYGILLLTGRVFIGDTRFGQTLLTVAICTMMIGSLGALVSVDMKHILACSSVSQIGFMLAGTGTMCILDREQWLAVQGTMLHMANHSLFKLVLFLCAGIVVRNLHTRDLNKLRGFGVGRPWFMVIFLIAALGIAGIPGLSGFVSKSMLHESLVLCYHESGLIYYKIAEILFLIAGGCTLAYMLKLFLILFFRKPSKEVEAFNQTKKAYLPLSLKILLSIPAAVIYLAGTLPEYLMFPLSERAAKLTEYMPAEETFRTFTAENVKGAVISCTIGLLLWWFVVKKLIEKRVSKNEMVYINRFPAKLDLENAMYRPILLTFLPTVCGAFCRFLERFTELIAKGVFGFLKRLFGLLDRTPELTVTGLQRSVFKPVCETTTLSATRRLSKFLGKVIGAFVVLKSKITRKPIAEQKNYTELVNRGLNDASETAKLITRSLSYGLLAFCAGLLAMLVYLLYCLQ